MKKVSSTILSVLTNMEGLVMVFLIIHLTAVYGKIVYFINPDKMFPLQEAILAGVIAFGYSLLTINMIAKSGNRWINLLFAALDFAAVFLYYNDLQYIVTPGGLSVFIRSTFLAFLTSLGVFSIGELYIKPKEQKEPIKEPNIDLYKKGYYLYIKGRFNIGNDPKKRQIAEEFEKRAGEINIDLIEETLNKN